MDDLFNESPAPAPAPEPIPTHEPIVVASEPAPEPIPTPTAKPEPPEEIGNTDKERAFLSKANDEKRKRQGFEREVGELKKNAEAREIHWQDQQRQWQQQNQQPIQQQELEIPKLFWEDPDAKFAAFEAQMQAREEKMQVREVAATLNTVERIARAKYPDFEEKLVVFAEVMRTTPGVHKEWINSPDQAEYAYRLGASTLAFQQAKDMPTLIEQAREQGRLEAETAYRLQNEERKAKLDAIPGSLTDTSSTGNSRVVWAGVPSLDDILS